MIQAKVIVQLKDGVLDPEAETTTKAAMHLGFDAVKKVVIQKCFLVQVEAQNTAEALKVADQLAQKLLVNPVIENYQVEIDHASI